VLGVDFFSGVHFPFGLQKERAFLSSSTPGLFSLFLQGTHSSPFPLRKSYSLGLPPPFPCQVGRHRPCFGPPPRCFTLFGKNASPALLFSLPRTRTRLHLPFCPFFSPPSLFMGWRLKSGLPFFFFPRARNNEVTIRFRPPTPPSPLSHLHLCSSSSFSHETGRGGFTIPFLSGSSLLK